MNEDSSNAELSRTCHEDCGSLQCFWTGVHVHRSSSRLLLWDTTYHDACRCHRHVTQSEVRSKLIPALKAVRLEVEVEKIEAALESGFRIVTARDEESPFSVDVILAREKLERRVSSILGIPTYYQTPEALVLTELRVIRATVPPERA